MELTTLLALGVPALIAAAAVAVQKVPVALADARLKSAEAQVKSAEAARLRAEAEHKREESSRVVVLGAEADAETVRGILSDMRNRLDRAEKRHEGCEERLIEIGRKCDEALKTKETQITALWKECGELRSSIDMYHGAK